MEYLESLPESRQAALGRCQWPGWADATFWQNCALAATHLALLQSLGASTGEKRERKKWKKSIEIRLDQQQKSKSAYIKAATLFPSSSGLASLWLCRLNLNPACPDKVHSFLQVLTAAQKSHGQEKMTTDTINPTCTQSQARSTPWMTQYWLLHLKYQFLCRSLLGQNTACKCPG